MNSLEAIKQFIWINVRINTGIALLRRVCLMIISTFVYVLHDKKTTTTTHVLEFFSYVVSTWIVSLVRQVSKRRLINYVRMQTSRSKSIMNIHLGFLRVCSEATVDLSEWEEVMFIVGGDHCPPFAIKASERSWLMLSWTYVVGANGASSFLSMFSHCEVDLRSFSPSLSFFENIIRVCLRVRQVRRA